MTTCAINCSINSSQQLELDSGHQELQEPRTNDFLYELDIDNNESVDFEIPDFTHGNNDYAVSVTAIRDGGTTETWNHNGQAATSFSEPAEVELSITVVATPSSGPTVTGGGVIRVEPKGKPD